MLRQQLQRQCGGERREMSPICRRDARKSERLSERDDGGIDEPKFKILELSM